MSSPPSFHYLHIRALPAVAGRALVLSEAFLSAPEK